MIIQSCVFPAFINGTVACGLSYFLEYVKRFHPVFHAQIIIGAILSRYSMNTDELSNKVIPEQINIGNNFIHAFHEKNINGNNIPTHIP
jgi:hypothetical protein